MSKSVSGYFKTICMKEKGERDIASQSISHPFLNYQLDILPHKTFFKSPEPRILYIPDVIGSRRIGLFIVGRDLNFYIIKLFKEHFDLLKSQFRSPYKLIKKKRCF